MINFNKFLLYLSRNTTRTKHVVFIDSLNRKTSDTIETNLRLPMIGGKNENVLFRSIKDKI